MEVQKADNRQEWDSLLEGADYATIFHKWEWLKALEAHGGGSLHALMFMKGDSPAALIPIFMKKRAGLKLVFSPPSQSATPYLGPVFKGYLELKQNRRESLIMEFQEAFEAYLREDIRPDYEFVSTTPEFLDIRPWLWAGYEAKPLYNYVFDLTLGVDALWSGLKRELRNEITRAQKANITVREGDRKDYLTLISEIKDRYDAQGISEPTSIALLTEFFDSFYLSNLRVLIAEHEGQRVGGMVDLIHGGTTLSWIGGVKSDVSGASPNALLQWEGISRAAQTGQKRYIEMGANTRRLCSFKRQFNPYTQQYFNLRRYPNMMLRAVESGYLNLFKPLRNKISSGRKKQ